MKQSLTLDYVPVIGILGVGRLGGTIANRLVDDHALILCDIEPDVLAPYRDRAQIVENLGSLVERADIILLCLSSARATHEAVMSALWPKAIQGQVFINLGSADARITEVMANKLKEQGISLLAAPVSGSALQAAAGELTVFASGDSAAFDRVQVLMRRFSREIFYLGEDLSLAQIAKLTNNFLSLANLAIASEASVLGIKSGLDPQQILDVFNAGMGQSSATSTRLPYHILSGSFHYGRTLDLVIADLSNFEEHAESQGVAPSHLRSAVNASYQRALDAMSADADVCEVIRPMERDAGILVRWPGDGV